ncbi:MAG: YkgJ family cysteine cluster protein [Desulfobulbaceae bacterium]
MVVQRREGFPYSFDPAACSRCPGTCCRGRSGNIWVSSPEIDRIAAYLSISRIELVMTFLRSVDNRFSIRERPGDQQYECVFLDTVARGCTIYPVRPAQCRSFPFWDYFRTRLEELARECPGVRPMSRVGGSDSVSSPGNLSEST